MSNYLDLNVSHDSFDNNQQKNENYDFLNDLDNLDNENKKTDDKNKQVKLDNQHNNANKNSRINRRNLMNKNKEGTVQNIHIQQINSPIEDIDINNKNTQQSKKSEKKVQSTEDNQQKYVHNNQYNSEEQILSNEFANDFGVSQDTKQDKEKNENNEFLQNIERTNNLALQRNEFNDEDDQYDDENYEDDFETNTNNASKMNSSPNKFDGYSNNKQDKQEANIFQQKNQNGKDLQVSNLENSLISNKCSKKIQKDNLLDVQDISEIKVEKINESSYDQNLENQNQKLQLLQNLNQANPSSLEKQHDILNKHPLRKVMTNQEKILLEKRQQQKQDSLNFQESQMGIEQQHSIKVMARVRPLVQIEKHSDIVLEVNEEQNTLNFIDKGVIKEMKFWKTFNPQSKQQDIFNNLKNNIQDVLNGFNFTILAYGQTGSGKTYSMFGADWEQVFQSYLHQNQQKEQKSNKNFIKQQMTLLENTSEDENFTGIMPRSIALLFDELNNIQKIGQQTYNVYCSFFQIYNEKIYDLLNENRDPLQIRTSALDGLFIDGLTEFKSENYINTIQIMKRGEQFRKIRETRMNTKSSRSHTVFRISLEEITENENGLIKKSYINMVDLAGSEKINKSEIISNEHLKELQNINQSLTTLGKVIHGLSHDKKKRQVIPYRESKLTRILQESLSGNSKTFVLGTLSPSFYNIQETISTLNFLERAQQIKTKVKQNTVVKSDQIIIQKLMKEISYLKTLLNQKRTGNINEIQITQELKIKLMHLEEENQKLKFQQRSTQDIQSILNENNKLKIKLQQMSNSNNQENKESSIPQLPQIKGTQKIEKSDNKANNSQEYASHQNSIQINRSKLLNHNISQQYEQKHLHADVVTYRQNQFQIRVRGHNEITSVQSSIQIQEEKRNKELKRILERINFINQAQEDNKQLLQNQLKRIQDTKNIQDSSLMLSNLNYQQQRKEQLLKEKQQKLIEKYQLNSTNNQLSSNQNSFSQNIKNNNKQYSLSSQINSKQNLKALKSSRKALSNISFKNQQLSTQGIGKFKKNINKAKTPLEKHKERMLKFQRELVALENQFP